MVGVITVGWYPILAGHDGMLKKKKSKICFIHKQRELMLLLVKRITLSLSKLVS